MALDENHLARMVRESRDASVEVQKSVDNLAAGVAEMNSQLAPFKFEREQILRDLHDQGQKIDQIDGRLRVVESKAATPITVVVPQPGPAVPTAETTSRGATGRRMPTLGLANRIATATTATRMKLAVLVLAMMLGTAMLAVLASVLIINRG